MTEQMSDVELAAIREDDASLTLDPVRRPNNPPAEVAFAEHPQATNVRLAYDRRALLAEVDRLRAELAPDPGPCDAEIHSWERYRSEQIDSYWIRCSLTSGHEGKHEDSNTGLTWED